MNLFDFTELLCERHYCLTDAGLTDEIMRLGAGAAVPVAGPPRCPVQVVATRRVGSFVPVKFVVGRPDILLRVLPDPVPPTIV